jgi:hypothetical protein
MPTIEQLVTLAEVDLLKIGGVDNWDWHSEAMADYVESEDAFEDAGNYLSALQSNGVDNWDWYGESLTGLDQYEEYLRALPSLDDALDVFGWKENLYSSQEGIRVQDNPPLSVEPPREKHKPNGQAAKQVFEHIASKFGKDRAEDIYDVAVEKGLWKQSTFPKEFKRALKEIQKGVKDPLEVARQKLVSTVIKNGKLDIFLTGVA